MSASTPKPAWNNALMWTVFAAILIWLLLPVGLQLFAVGTVTPTPEQAANLDQLQTMLGWGVLFIIGLWAVFSYLIWDGRVKAEAREHERWRADAPHRDARRRQALRDGNPNWWEVQ